MDKSICKLTWFDVQSWNGPIFFATIIIPISRLS